MAHQHLLGYSVPETAVEDVIKNEDMIAIFNFFLYFMYYNSYSINGESRTPVIKQ